MKTTITATTSVDGLHHWPDAPARRAYLGFSHRHVFGVQVTVEVGHNDRQVEWHDLADEARAALRGVGRHYHHETTLTDFGPRSCEMLAIAVAERLGDLFTVVRVRVDEDGEHWATWERDS